MTNKNKKINELVADDDDITAELEALTVQRAFGPNGPQLELESDANTFDLDDLDHDEVSGVSVSDLKSDLKVRSETIERLQFDIQQLHAKWLGLEAEIKAREELTSDLTADLKSTGRELDRRDKLLQKRNDSIKALKTEIRERETKIRDLQALTDEYRAAKLELESGDEITAARQRIVEFEGHIAAQAASLTETRTQLERTESYTDELRWRLADVTENSEGAFSEREKLRDALSEAEGRIDTSQADLKRVQASSEELSEALAEARAAHEQEIRTLRFELTDAETTIAERDQLSEQLAADLVDINSHKDLLEQMLTDNDQQNQARIEELEKQLKKQQFKIADYEDKLETKSDAINSLLSELAKKSREFDSIGQMEDVIQDIDDRMSERIDERPAVMPGDRVARLLIGRVDNQELRFPLFKDRLTIGRTQQNDIQLKAQYVSRRHAVVVTEGDATRLVDWGSKNGVYVNSNRITEHFLKHGDVVTIGTVDFRYEELPKRDN
ncbi:MAG: FHA domain-containing protein [Gammaproteobacteria bacterium]|nr:FHA domain-containing protein [Gammaproteobacteria bacterium]